MGVRVVAEEDCAAGPKPADAIEVLSISAMNASSAELAALEVSLLNKSGNVPLHKRFRALFTLKALKSADAIRIISAGLTLD